ILIQFTCQLIAPVLQPAAALKYTTRLVLRALPGFSLPSYNRVPHCNNSILELYPKRTDDKRYDKRIKHAKQLLKL
ncbi:MAG: hypothetical protein KDJ99_33155, partial [Candidatus Competibacteraceae bacterium]|nr:hypothetical protein [Candidatus Competibacteraceae bacterium]